MFLIKKAFPTLYKKVQYYHYTEQGNARFTTDPWHAARLSASEVDTVVKHLNMLAAGDYTVYATPAKDEGVF